MIIILEVKGWRNVEGKEKWTYEKLNRRYQKLSHENMMRGRKKDTTEGYEKARSREQLIRKAFFADCKRYLDENSI